jgi:uncharacterized protein YndB with AHSA1/START domain
MTDRSVVHRTFTIERVFAAPPRRVFAAWSNPDAKRRWASCHTDEFDVEYHLDFRVGGTELNRASAADGPVHVYQARFLDIVPDHRIIYAYDMHFRDKRVSVSLATVTFEAVEIGTRMTFTEQVAFLDGFDGLVGRSKGTEAGFDRLEAELGERLLAHR